MQKKIPSAQLVFLLFLLLICITFGPKYLSFQANAQTATTPMFHCLAASCPSSITPSQPIPTTASAPKQAIMQPTTTPKPCNNASTTSPASSSQTITHTPDNQRGDGGLVKKLFQLILLLLELIQGKDKAIPCTPEKTLPLPPTMAPPTMQPLASLLKPAATFTTHKNLRFSNTSPRLLLDLYTPNNNSNAPVIVWLYGGGWEAGSKDQNCFPKDLQLMKQGFAVACVNYRLTDEAPFPAQIEDVKSAVRWLRANAATYKLYDKKIGIWGGSAGAHLAALAGTTGDTKTFDKGENLSYPSTVEAVVDMAGPTDLIAWAEPPLYSSSPELTRILTKLLGGPLAENQEKAQTANPINYITPNDPPFMIFHGELDISVPVSQSQRLHNALQATGVKTTLTIFPGQDHGAPDFLSPKTTNTIVSFFDGVLR